MRKKEAEAFARLARFIEDRADELALSWNEVASAADITPQTLRAVRKGENQPSRGTKRGLERALRWAMGSVDQVLEGGQPAPLLEPRKSGVATNQELIAAAHRDLDAIEEELDRRLRAARRDPEQLEQVLQKIREVQGDDVEG